MYVSPGRAFLMQLLGKLSFSVLVTPLLPGPGNLWDFGSLPGSFKLLVSEQGERVWRPAVSFLGTRPRRWRPLVSPTFPGQSWSLGPGLIVMETYNEECIYIQNGLEGRRK